MKYLKEIAQIITRKKIMKIEVFDKSLIKDKSSKFNQFYDSLLDNSFETDNDASQFLYNATPLDDRYRQIKSRFRKRILNTLFFIDLNQPSNSNYDRAYFSVNRDWTLVKILLANKAYKTSASLARSIFVTGIKYQFADVIVNSARILRDNAARTNNEKDYEHYDQHCKQYANVLEAEIRSEELYQRVVMNYYKPISKSSDLKDRIDIYCEALSGLSDSYSSPVIYFNKVLVWIFRSEMLQDYEEMLRLCDECIAYMEANPDYIRTEVSVMMCRKKLLVCLHTKDFDRARKIADTCKKFSKGSDEWFELMELYIHVAIYTDNMIDARESYAFAVSISKFKGLTKETRDRWAVFDSYINMYFYTHPNYKARYGSHKTRTFKLNKFDPMNDESNKNERMIYVHQLIIKAIFLYQDDELDKCSEVLDELKFIANRNLKKKEEYIRLVQFIKLLQQWKKSDYLSRPMTNTLKYTDSLDATPFVYRELLDELELIPYDYFWSYIQKLHEYKR